MSNNILTFDGVHGNSYDLYIGSANLLWSGSAFSVVTTAGWSSFAIAGTEQDTTGRFQWTMPAAIPSNPGYSFTVRQRLTGTALPSDPIDGAFSYSWDGTNLGVSLIGTTGLDSVIGEPSAGSFPAINVRQMVALIFNAACYGLLNNANGSPSTISNPAGTITRATITQDQFGNRTNIQFNNLP